MTDIDGDDDEDEGCGDDEDSEEEKKGVKIKSAFAVLLDEGVRPRLVTFVPELDRLLGGGVPTSSITELCLCPFPLLFFFLVWLNGWWKQMECQG